MSIRELDAPIAVRTIDLAAEPVDVDLGRDPDGRRYNGLYALLMRDGLAAGAICVRANAGVVTARELRRAIDEIAHAGATVGELPAAAGGEPRFEPLVSVVICAIDGGRSAVRTVETVLSGTYSKVEVIVVNNRPAEGGLQPVAAAFGEDPRVRTTDEPRPGLSFARNAGAAVARGEIVAFTDDDTVPDSRWIERVVAAFASQPDVACVTGLIVPLSLDSEGQVLLERFAGFSKGFLRRRWSMAESAHEPLFPYRAGQFGSGANVALRAEALALIGGYDDALGIGTPAGGGEDLDLFIRVVMNDMALAYEPTAVVWHEHPSAIEHIEREVALYGAGLGAAMFKQLWRGPRRGRLLRSAAGGVHYALSPSSDKNVRRGHNFPIAYMLAELRGMVRGPLGYLRSHRFANSAGAAVSRAGAASVPASFEPVWVGEIELNCPPEDLTAPPREDGAPFARASLLVRISGEPAGFVKLPLRDGRAAADEVRARIERELGERIAEIQRQAAQTAAKADAGAASAGPPTPRASVVVCTRDRPESLGRTLRSAIALDYPDFEIVVVDNSPETDGTRRAVEAAGSPLIRYVAEPVPGLSRARNRGLSAARGDFVAFTDDDVVVDRDWLRMLAAAIARNPNVGCVTGLVPTAELRTRQQLVFDESVGWSGALRRRVFDLGEHRGEGLLYPFRSGRIGTGANFAITREALSDVGPFDEALGAGTPCGGGEDLDYFLRVIESGRAIAVEPAAIAWHYHRADAQSLRRQFYSYGSGAFAYATKFMLQPARGIRIAARSLHAARSHPTVLAATGPPATPGDRNRVEPDLRRAKWRGRMAGPILYLRGRRECRGREPIAIGGAAAAVEDVHNMTAPSPGHGDRSV